MDPCISSDLYFYSFSSSLIAVLRIQLLTRFIHSSPTLPTPIQCHLIAQLANMLDALGVDTDCDCVCAGTKPTSSAPAASAPAVSLQVPPTKEKGSRSRNGSEKNQDDGTEDEGRGEDVERACVIRAMERVVFPPLLSSLRLITPRRAFSTLFLVGGACWLIPSRSFLPSTGRPIQLVRTIFVLILQPSTRECWGRVYCSWHTLVRVRSFSLVPPVH